MTNSLQATEDASAAIAKAPRVSKDFIESQIDKCVFSTGDSFIAGSQMGDPRGGPAWSEVANSPDLWQEDYAHHTFCLLTTNAGFTVVGHSAPASPENFNAELGRQFAYENAFRQLWPLFAFAMLEANNSSQGEPT